MLVADTHIHVIIPSGLARQMINVMNGSIVNIPAGMFNEMMQQFISAVQAGEKQAMQPPAAQQPKKQAKDTDNG